MLNVLALCTVWQLWCSKTIRFLKLLGSEITCIKLSWQWVILDITVDIFFKTLWEIGLVFESIEFFFTMS